jgi:DNA-binding transcriptional LysR family regulator
MPAELVQSDLARGTLVKIVAADAPPQGFVLSMHAVYRTEAPPGIAARWFIDRLNPLVGKALHKAPSELASPLFSDPNATPREFAPVRRS